VWRHGQTGHNAGGLWQGQLDTDLSELGVEQARQAAAVLAGLEPRRIVSSDLRRAAHTAAELGALTGIEVRHDERLREIDVGTWQGMSQGDVAERYPDEHAALGRGEDIRRGEHGESVQHVRERVHAAAMDLLEDLADDETAVVATHGVAGRALAAVMVGMDQQSAWLMLGGLHNCHWAELVEHRTGWRIVAWNVGAGPVTSGTSDH
jgi:broad specificity phosphatase PhoE